MDGGFPKRVRAWSSTLAPTALSIAVLALCLWSVSFATRVAELRADVESHVGWLIELRRVDALLHEGGPDAAPEADQLLAALATEISAARPDLGPEVRNIQRLVSTDPPAALQASGALVDTIRAENAVTSATLGALVDRLNLLVAAGTVLGLTALGVLIWGRSRSEDASRAEDRADALEAQLDYLIGASPAVLYTAEPEPPFRVTFVSRNAARVFGHPPDVIGGRRWFGPGQDDAAHRVAADALQNGRSVGEYQVVGPSGHPIWVRDECRLADENERRLLVGCLTDVTDRQLARLAAERALADTEAAVARAVAERDFLVSAASHDLSEPIRKIQVFSDLLSESVADRVDGESREYIALLRDSARRLQVLVRDLLDYSRSDAEPVVAEALELRDVVEAALDDLSVLVEESGATVRVHELPRAVGDAAQLRRVVQNLVENALTHRDPDDRPEVDIRGRHVLDGESAWVELEVADQGIGFDPHFAERLTEPFFRLHSPAGATGSGIGLAICRKIVERHSGTIKAWGRPGEGATFTVRLPANPTSGGDSNG